MSAAVLPRSFALLISSIFCFSAALAVALGAFGAHALKAKVTIERLATWSTANQYHMIHSLAGVLLVLVFSYFSAHLAKARWALILFLAGIGFFSGSLYCLVLLDLPLLGAVAPIGGLSFIAGWVLSALAILEKRKSA